MRSYLPAKSSAAWRCSCFACCSCVLDAGPFCFLTFPVGYSRLQVSSKRFSLHGAITWHRFLLPSMKQTACPVAASLPAVAVWWLQVRPDPLPHTVLGYTRQLAPSRRSRQSARCHAVISGRKTSCISSSSFACCSSVLAAGSPRSSSSHSHRLHQAFGTQQTFAAVCPVPGGHIQQKDKLHVQ